MKRHFLAATLSASALLPGWAGAGMMDLTSLFVIGDSLLDSGNAGLLTGNTFPPAPYAGGRSSNGPVASEYLWQMFNPGDPGFAPSLAGGPTMRLPARTRARRTSTR